MKPTPGQAPMMKKGRETTRLTQKNADNNPFAAARRH